MGYLLDTNVLIHASKNAGAVRHRLQQQPPSALFTTVVTLAELMYGASKNADPIKSRQAWLKVLAPYGMLDFDQASAHEHARIRGLLRQKPIGERDLLIASIATSRKLTVISHNLSEFTRVPGLPCLDWFPGNE